MKTVPFIVRIVIRQYSPRRPNIIRVRDGRRFGGRHRSIPFRINENGMDDWNVVVPIVKVIWDMSLWMDQIHRPFVLQLAPVPPRIEKY